MNEEASGDDSLHIRCRIDELLAAREMSLADLSKQVGITYANLSVLKNNHARAVRFSTLTLLCEALNCSVGDLFVFDPEWQPQGVAVVPDSLAATRRKSTRLAVQ